MDMVGIDKVKMIFADGFADTIEFRYWSIGEYYDKIRYWQNKYTANHGMMINFELMGGCEAHE